MLYPVLADLAVLAHAAFVLFVAVGGLAVLFWPRLALLHLPAVIWGVVIEFTGWVCPLTYLENRFRRLSGEAGYSGTFIQYYLEPILYPLGLTLRHQLLLGGVALVVNALIYACLWRKTTRRSG